MGVRIPAFGVLFAGALVMFGCGPGAQPADRTATGGLASGAGPSSLTATVADIADTPLPLAPKPAPTLAPPSSQLDIEVVVPPEEPFEPPPAPPAAGDGAWALAGAPAGFEAVFATHHGEREVFYQHASA